MMKIRYVFHLYCDWKNFLGLKEENFLKWENIFVGIKGHFS